MSAVLFCSNTIPPAQAAPLEIAHEKYVLPSNGLEVILHEDHRLPIVAVNIWYHAGPANEPPGRTGFAHLFEHLMFQGSRNVGDDEHFTRLQAAGATYLNGTTDYDRTNYFQTVPSNRLALVLWLESDRMGFLLDALTQEKLDNQREVVKNERRQSVDNVPYGPSSEKLIQSLFPENHPYHGQVIGSMEHLNAATLRDVREFFQHYYAPANATLVIAGDIDVAQTKELVLKYFGSLARRESPPRRRVHTPPLEQEHRLIVEESVQLPRIEFAWLSPPAFQQGDAQADIIASILGQGRSSRLYRELVYEQQIAQSVSAHQESLALSSIFSVSITGRRGASIEKLEQAAQTIINDIRDEPVQAWEIERARNLLRTRMMSSLQRVGGFGGKADTLNRYNRYLGTPDFLAQDLARYDAIRPSDLQEFARSLLQDTQRVIVITVPRARDAS